MINRISTDAGFRQLLQVAREWGVSPRRFLGWEPARITLHEYNESDQLVRSITQLEPEWTQEDRDAAFALASWEADLCRSCGEPLAETTLPEHEDQYRPKPAIRCHRCTASSQAAERYKDAPHPSALLIPIELRATITEESTDGG